MPWVSIAARVGNRYTQVEFFEHSAPIAAQLQEVLTTPHGDLSWDEAILVSSVRRSVREEIEYQRRNVVEARIGEGVVIQSPAGIAEDPLPYWFTELPGSPPG